MRERAEREIDLSVTVDGFRFVFFFFTYITRYLRQFVYETGVTIKTRRHTRARRSRQYRVFTIERNAKKKMVKSSQPLTECLSLRSYTCARVIDRLFFGRRTAMALRSERVDNFSRRIRFTYDGVEGREGQIRSRTNS